jgi:beta-1,4-N-acetylglucosaminyltransferase
MHVLLRRLLGYLHTRIVYVESIARVRRLSLSGKILYHSRMADVVFVQWEELQRCFPRTVFAGSLY